MNRAFCNSCKALVPADRVERDGRVYLVKHCGTCGETESLVSSDAARHMSKRQLDPGFACEPCEDVQCVTCRHHREPTYAFVDVTNRCNLNCPVCADAVASHGFAFDPPMAYFERVFEHLSHFRFAPTVALFGGEPTMRDDLPEIVRLSRSYGYETRVLTNGLRLADRDFAERLVKARAHLLVSYDGDNPETYRQMRGTAKALELKQRAIANLATLPRAKVSFVTCLAWGHNHEDLPRILDFYHQHRHMLHGVYLMPLVATWELEEFDYRPERMTTEDVETLLAECFPGYSCEFISLGLASHFRVITGCFGETSMPWHGGHPNCESFYLLVSDGEHYVPIDHFLRRSLPEVAGAFLKLESRLADREARWERSRLGRALDALRLRRFVLRVLGLAGVLATAARHIRLPRLLKGRGLGKLGHAVMMGVERLLGRKSRLIRERHTNWQDVLRIVVLPLEDDPILETERLERCPCVHVTHNPQTGETNYVPVCSWRLHNKQILGELKAAFEAAEPVASEATA